METATVDIRRLQTLSDCINRTIDALNQVRLSVHGVGTPNALGVVPTIGGLAHAAAQNPFVTGQLAQQLVNPLVSQFANPFAAVATNPFANPYNNYNAWAGTGLGHSAFVSQYADPYATARIAQTFPFLHWGYSPFAWSTI
jgi:hypothetical protein